MPRANIFSRFDPRLIIRLEDESVIQVNYGYRTKDKKITITLLKHEMKSGCPFLNSVFISLKKLQAPQAIKILRS